MPLINLLIVLIAIGVVLWIVNNLIPMDARIRTIINILVLVVIVLWLLQIMFGPLSDIRIGR